MTYDNASLKTGYMPTKHEHAIVEKTMAQADRVEKL